MQTVGIHQENSTLFIATVDRGRLLETKTCPVEDVKPFDSHTITGLGFDKVLRRELTFKLKRRSQIFAAIPFQAEGVVPYPLAEAILYPEFIRSKKGTDVVLLATKRIFLEQHIAEFQLLGIDPVQVATLPTALAQWAQFSYPDKPEVAVFYDRCCVVCQKGKIVFSQSFEEKDRLKAFLQTKFPQAEPLQADAMAVAIGLALDKVQLRTGSFVSEQSRRLKKKETVRYVAAALILAASVWGLGRRASRVSPPQFGKTAGRRSPQRTNGGNSARAARKEKRASAFPAFAARFGSHGLARHQTLRCRHHLVPL